MPKSEVYFERSNHGFKVSVMKTYDRAYAREAFESMDEVASRELWNALRVEDEYDSEIIGSLTEESRLDLLWEELLDSSREDGNIQSFFVVKTNATGDPHLAYVSPDWPSAERFALALTNNQTKWK